MGSDYLWGGGEGDVVGLSVKSFYQLFKIIWRGDDWDYKIFEYEFLDGRIGVIICEVFYVEFGEVFFFGGGIQKKVGCWVMKIISRSGFYYVYCLLEYQED